MAEAEKLNFTAVYEIAELSELAEIFEALARNRSRDKGIHPMQTRGAILAFTLAASITRRTIMGKQDAKN